MIGVPALAAFNVAANIRFAPAAESFIEGRDEAALRFKQRGHLAGSTFRLYPIPERAERILDEVARRGIYWVPRMCEQATIDEATLSSRITYHVDVMTAGDGATYLSGWAAALRAYAADTADLVTALEAITAGKVESCRANGDITHGDFSPGNVLVDRGQISGIVDWDAAEKNYLAATT